MPDARVGAPGRSRQVSALRHDLLLEGTRFAMLRHIAQKPLMVAVMVALILLLMAAVMMMLMR